MRERRLFVGEIGKKITVEVGISLQDVSTITLMVEKPDGTTAVEWAATTLGAAANGQVYYTTQSGDLSVAGIYRLYVKLVYGGGQTFYGERTYFEVYNPSEG